MKKVLRIVFPLMILVSAVVSCGRGGRVIPVRKMEGIYREMLLADQWLAENPDKRGMADTTWFYEPVFEKYGFTLEDYQKSVDHYLNDPKRYAEMLGRVERELRKELSAINAELALRDRLQHEADSLVKAWKSVKAKSFNSFMDVYEQDAMTDRIGFEKDSLLGWRLVPVVEDTMYHGPSLIIRDSAEVACKDSLSMSAELPSSSVPMKILVPETLDRKPGRALTSEKAMRGLMKLSPSKDISVQK